ncbi:hypothetical protein E4U53_002959, partial [Claviceps sorghi]
MASQPPTSIPPREIRIRTSRTVKAPPAAHVKHPAPHREEDGPSVLAIERQERPGG